MKNLLLIAIIGLTLTVSCVNKEHKENVESEKIELRQLLKTNEYKTTKSGSFFLIAADYHSRETREVSIEVFGKVGEGYRYIKMPLEKVRIIIDSSVSDPYIIIKPRRYYSLDEVLNEGYGAEYYKIFCREEYLPEKLLPIEL